MTAAPRMVSAWAALAAALVRKSRRCIFVPRKIEYATSTVGSYRSELLPNDLSRHCMGVKTRCLHGFSHLRLPGERGDAMPTIARWRRRRCRARLGRLRAVLHQIHASLID